MMAAESTSGSEGDHHTMKHVVMDAKGKNHEAEGSRRSRQPREM